MSHTRKVKGLVSDKLVQTGNSKELTKNIDNSQLLISGEVLIISVAECLKDNKVFISWRNNDHAVCCFSGLVEVCVRQC